MAVLNGGRLLKVPLLCVGILSGMNAVGVESHRQLHRAITVDAWVRAPYDAQLAAAVDLLRMQARRAGGAQLRADTLAVYALRLIESVRQAADLRQDLYVGQVLDRIDFQQAHKARGKAHD